MESAPPVFNSLVCVLSKYSRHRFCARWQEAGKRELSAPMGSEYNWERQVVSKYTLKGIPRQASPLTGRKLCRAMTWAAWSIKVSWSVFVNLIQTRVV